MTRIRNRKNKTWTIYDERALTYHLVKMPFAGIESLDYPHLLYDILEILFPDQMLLTQFIDVSQHSRDIEPIKSELGRLFDLEIRTSSSLINLIEEENSLDTYYTHVSGWIKGGWLRHLVRFGGTSLSNTVWMNHDGRYGINDLQKWNKGLFDEFFGDEDNTFRDVLKIHQYFCFTLDAWFILIYPDGYSVDNIFSKIKAISKINGYEIVVKHGGLNERLI
jgi:hypothetical protein